ncbi:MAG: hypothetical protein QOE90_1803 [Thermoplasmata archaeon]|jgi:Fe-S-cluster containining protein|nr:hypothetical protein [Thermoplasmata archaeon]
MRVAELAGRRFGCLEGCGFCCTFQPEATQRELARLRARLAPRPLPVVAGQGRTYLALHNKCGACTLLERRACQAYDLRPQHCRYFPFHLHFAEEPEAYVNYTCRGVELSADGDLSVAFRESVLENAGQDEIARHEQLAKQAYGEFQRTARRRGVWGDADAVARGADLGALLTREGIEAAIRRGGDEATAQEAWDDALAPFAEDDVTRRPFYLAPDLRWLTFARSGEGLDVLEMDEQGALLPRGRLDDVAAWRDGPADLAPYFASLVARRVFTGSVYALVDDEDYAISVEQATWLRLAEVAADLAARAHVLAKLGVPADRIEDETARFYDSAFLDAPTIGGFL